VAEPPLARFAAGATPGRARAVKRLRPRTAPADDDPFWTFAVPGERHRPGKRRAFCCTPSKSSFLPR